MRNLAVDVGRSATGTVDKRHAGAIVPSAVSGSQVAVWGVLHVVPARTTGAA